MRSYATRIAHLVWSGLVLVGLVLGLGLAATSVTAQSGPAPQPLRIADENVRAMWITADNRSVVYLAVRDGQDALWSVPATGGSSTRLSPPFPTGTVLPSDSQLTITPDSRFVTYLGQHPDDRTPQLYRAAVTGGPPVRLNQTLGGSENIVSSELSSAGHAVVFSVASDVSSRATRTVWSVPLAGGTPVQLNPPLVADQRVTTVRLSPDGARVVFNVSDSSDSSSMSGRLFSVPVGGGTPTLLIQSPAIGGTIGFEITPDRSRVVYEQERNQNDHGDLWIVPITGGAAAKIVSADGRTLRSQGISADSTVIVYTLDTTLYSAPLQPGAAPVLLSTPHARRPR